MTLAVATASLGLPSPPYPVWRFTVAQYHRMIEAGVLSEDDPVELLEGWIVPKMARNPPHDVCLCLTEKAINVLLPSGWHVRGQSAITTDTSEPEPDVAIVRGNIRDYVNRHPKPGDIAFLVEVAESSLDRDREDKGRIYARASIAIYWIINLVDRVIEIYTDPTGPVPQPHYRRRHDHGMQDTVPLVLAGQHIGQIDVRELLP